jgi:beta-lactamase superfamily II metal-dependent hydrolase
MKSNNLKVYLFNVGAGDHILIEFPDSSIGIIDSFFSSDKLYLQEPPAVTYLKYRIAEKKKSNQNEKIQIAFLCLSHADHDHIKGINALFNLLIEEDENIELENLLLFGGIDFDSYKEEINKLNTEILCALDEEAKEEFEKRALRLNKELEAIKEFKENWRRKTKKTELYFNDFKEFDKYNPHSRPYKAFSVGPIARLINVQETTNINNLISDIYERIQSFQNKTIFESNLKIQPKFNRNAISAILGINTHNNKLLFLGDATSETITASLEDIPKRNADAVNLLYNPNFVKASHHGSKGSTMPKIWDNLLTEKDSNVLFGISAGEDKRNKHPHNEFYIHVNECCINKNINNFIYRTNECAVCDNKPRNDGEIDLDFWFQFHGCKIEDIRLQDALENDSPDLYGCSNEKKLKNLLAYIFEFPCNSNSEKIKVYRGVSDKIGHYSKCVFGDKNKYYCKSDSVS